MAIDSYKKLNINIWEKWGGKLILMG